MTYLLTLFRRGDDNSFPFQSRPQCPRKFNRARGIAMEADGFGPNRNVGSIHSANFSFLQHSHNPLSRLRWIMQQRLRLRSGNERAVAVIVAVRENFGRGWQSQFLAALNSSVPAGANRIARVSTANTPCAISSDNSRSRTAIL